MLHYTYTVQLTFADIRRQLPLKLRQARAEELHAMHCI